MIVCTLDEGNAGLAVLSGDKCRTTRVGLQASVTRQNAKLGTCKGELVFAVGQQTVDQGQPGIGRVELAQREGFFEFRWRPVESKGEQQMNTDKSLRSASCQSSG